MARMPRIVVPNVPHHVTQWGNRRMQTFFSVEDDSTYMGYLAESVEQANTEVWAYCLMPNHVHLVLVVRQRNNFCLLYTSPSPRDS